jgi:hypothetical protein
VKVGAYHEVREYQQLLDYLHCVAEDDPNAVAEDEKGNQECGVLRFGNKRCSQAALIDGSPDA